MGLFDSIGDAFEDAYKGVAQFVDEVTLEPFRWGQDIAEFALDTGIEIVGSLGPAANLIAPGLGAVAGLAGASQPASPPQMIVMPTMPPPLPAPAPAPPPAFDLSNPTTLAILGGVLLLLVVLLVLV